MRFTACACCPIWAAIWCRPFAELAFTALAIAWLVPSSAPIVAIAVLCGIGVPLATRHIIAELDLRVRTHAGALSRFYLDSLLGLIAIRTHGAERSMRRAHENLMMEWAHAGINLQRANMLCARPAAHGRLGAW